MKVKSLCSRLGIIVSLGAGPFACGGDDSDLPTVDDIQTQVFNPTCAVSGCHVAPINAGGLNLEAPVRSKIVNVESMQTPKPLVDPGNVANSYLVDKIAGMMIFNSQMPPPPADPLPPADVTLVRTWIEDGAP